MRPRREPLPRRRRAGRRGPRGSLRRRGAGATSTTGSRRSAVPLILVAMLA
jgi:hypothetical protein